MTDDDELQKWKLRYEAWLEGNREMNQQVFIYNSEHSEESLPLINFPGDQVDAR